MDPPFINLGHENLLFQTTKKVSEPCYKSFISSSGQEVKLYKKKATNLSINEIDCSTSDSYGINIDTLLDNLESKEKAYKKKLTKKSSNDSILWVEKWRPRRFIDLIGNEKNNRTILKWLRQWSSLIFNETLPSLKYDVKSVDSLNLSDPQDPLQRPRKKILLIHGPPGVGKTSVSHIIAKQCGYSVMEINASDERSGPRIKDKIHNILFNQTFNEKPVCLVVDEIDGSMENGFIKNLIDIMNNDIKATKVLQGGDLKLSRKVLIRPIIAICNNIYASSLEKLRPFCEVIPFYKPSDKAIMERLEFISKMESLNVDKSFLSQICDLCQGDVRNTINNLQLLADNQVNVVSEPSGNRIKDISVSWYKICNYIFQKRSIHREYIRSNELLHLIDTNSNHNKIISGCFNLFPEVRYSDNGVKKPGEISEWLYFNDLMMNSLYEHNGELIKYSSYVPLAFYQLFSDIANKDDLKVKSLDFEMKETMKYNFSLTKYISSQIVPINKIFTNTTNLVLELLPHLDYIITSDLNKIKDVEVNKLVADNIIPLFKEFNLTIKTRRSDEAQVVLEIQPSFVSLIIMIENRIRDLSGRRSSILNRLLIILKKSQMKKRKFEEVTNEEKNKKSQITPVGNVHVGIKPSSIESFKHPPVRITLPFDKSHHISNQSNLHENVNELSKNVLEDHNLKIWVKYKEGFSNAVRKNVNWSSLWE